MLSDLAVLFGFSREMSQVATSFSRQGSRYEMHSALGIGRYGQLVRAVSDVLRRIASVLINGSGWALVGFADFKSVGLDPSVETVGSTPSRSRHYLKDKVAAI